MSVIWGKPEAHARGYAKALHVATYLLKGYIGIARNGATAWKDYGARDAYYVVVETWQIRRVG